MTSEFNIGRQPYFTDQLLLQVKDRRGKGFTLGLVHALAREHGTDIPLMRTISTVLLAEGKVVSLTQREVAAFEKQSKDFFLGVKKSQRESAREMGVSRRTYNNILRRATQRIEQLNPQDDSLDLLFS